MKFFKLVEIDEKEYVEQTRDLNYRYFCNNVSKANDIHPDDKNIYIAIDECEDEIRINIGDFEDENEDEDDDLDIDDNSFDDEN